MKNPRVFIVNYAGYDYSAAMKYGKLVPVTRGTVDIFKDRRMAYDITQALEDFDPETDYLLFSGSSFINVVASGILLSRFPKYKCLIYGAKRGDYVEREVLREWPVMLEESDDNPQQSIQDTNWNNTNNGYAELTSHSLRRKKNNNARNRR